MLLSIARMQQLLGHLEYWMTKSSIRQDDNGHVQDIQHTSNAWGNSSCPFIVCIRKNNRCCHGFRRRSFAHSPNLRRILTSTLHSQTHKFRKKSHRRLDGDLDGKRICLHNCEEGKQKESTRRSLALIVVILARKLKMVPNHQISGNVTNCHGYVISNGNDAIGSIMEERMAMLASLCVC